MDLEEATMSIQQTEFKDRITARELEEILRHSKRSNSFFHHLPAEVEDRD